MAEMKMTRAVDYGRSPVLNEMLRRKTHTVSIGLGDKWADSVETKCRAQVSKSIVMSRCPYL